MYAEPFLAHWVRVLSSFTVAKSTSLPLVKVTLVPSRAPVTHLSA